MSNTNADYLYLVKGLDGDRRAWYYVLVDQQKIDSYVKDLNNDSIHLDDYGKIIYSAYGEEPPAHITDLVKKEYLS